MYTNIYVVLLNYFFKLGKPTPRFTLARVNELHRFLNQFSTIFYEILHILFSSHAELTENQRKSFNPVNVKPTIAVNIILETMLSITL